MLDFKELEAFVWAVRLGSFRKAAMRLHLTQPSISERISRLESSVGEVLLERSARPIQPTMRGREFFVHAERLLQQRDAAIPFRKCFRERHRRVLMIAVRVELWVRRDDDGRLHLLQ